MKKTATMVGAAVGACVHVGGIRRFLRIAEERGMECHFAGAAVSVDALMDVIAEKKPDIVAVSYRLTPASAVKVFRELRSAIRRSKVRCRFIFGGTPPVARAAEACGIFHRVFDGTDTRSDIVSYLSGEPVLDRDEVPADTLIERIAQKTPYPILRHHFGRPTVAETVSGARAIAEAGVLDVLSIGPDQNAQEHFFHQGRMDRSQDGAGGVPLRTTRDLAAIYRVTRTGNHPLVRCYAGTNDLRRWAEMSVRYLHNAWGAIPLFWYSELDGRSHRPIAAAIAENQAVMRWYAERDIPVEVNDAHQWGLRNASDAVSVAAFYLAAYNARAAGVRKYVAQFMFNTPDGMSVEMDLGKMLAMKMMIDDLVDDRFSYYTQVRAGLLHFSSDQYAAKGQLAASALVSLALKPHILHVVGFSEGDHAVTADELIESCRIVHGVLRDTMHGVPDMMRDGRVRSRARRLRREAKAILHAISALGDASCDDPFTDPFVLGTAITRGILDAPDLKGICRGAETRIVDGASVPYDTQAKRVLSESHRIARNRG